jgi:hypothetical protein
MIRKKLILIALIIVLSACKKDKADDGKCRVTEMHEYVFDELVVKERYFYDELDRIVKVNYGFNVISITYTKNSITPKGSPSTIITSTLDN